MRKSVSICSVLLWLLLPTVVYAQYDANLFGHVLDMRTGEHMPFVTVQVKNTSIGGVTDESGHYFLKNLPVGRHVVSFSYVGYKTLELEVIITANKSTEMNVEMEEDVLVLGNVVVTADRYESKKKESSTILNVIPPVLFETTSAACMADALNYTPGVRVEQTCANCGQTKLRINGMEGQYSEMLIDSRPIFSSLAAVYGLDQIPTGMVDHVEVVRGGGSALYGANAIAGVVNIVTKEPTRNFINLSNTSSMLRRNAYDINTTLNASVISENQKIGAFLFAVQRNRNQYDHDNDGFSDIPKLNSTTAGVRSFFKITNYSKLTAEYHHVTEFRRGGNLFDLEPHLADIAEQLRHNIDAGSLTYDYFSANEKHHLKVFASAQNVNRESYFGAPKDPNGYGRSHDITVVTGAQYHFLYSCGKMPAELTIGTEYTYNHLHDKILGYHRDFYQTVHLVSMLAENEWKNDVWSANVGLRVEKHNLLRMPMVVPRVSFRYAPYRGIVLRTSYSAGYRAPQAYDEDLHVDAVGGNVSLISLDPNLKPEKSHSAFFSADYYQTFRHSELNLTLEGFFNYLDDVFFLRTEGHDDDGNLLMVRTNANGAYVAGLNAEGKFAYKDIVSLQAGYTFQKSRYTESLTWSDNPNIAPQKRMFRTPDNYAYMILTVKPVREFSIALNGKVSGNMLVQHFAGYIPQDEEVRTKPFWEFGAKLAYDIHLYKTYCLELNCGIKNIFNVYQPDLDKGVNRDAGYIYGPALPRTYFIGLNLKV